MKTAKNNFCLVSLLKISISSLLISGLFFIGGVQAESSTVSENEKTVMKTLSAKLKSVLRAEPDMIKPSKIPNLYEVMYGTEIVYLSADGEHFISGDMVNLKTRQNITDIARQSVRKTRLDAQNNQEIVFKAKDEKHVLKVFTDIDCPYCAKMHREVPTLNAKGITVEYLMFPRAGANSESFRKAVDVWCAEDQLTAMTTAKERRPLERKTCDNPIQAQYRLGQEIGVTGTPALVTKTGRLIPGYVPADRLLGMLNAEK